MSSSSNPDPYGKVCICGKKPATHRISVYVCDDEFAWVKPEHDAYVARLNQMMAQRPPPPPPPAPAPTPTETATEDKYGIKKIYPDDTAADRAQVWYMNMDTNPASDPRLNTADDATFTKQADGSWAITRPNNNGSIRVEAWSESGAKKWLNVEITVYNYLIGDLSSTNIASYVVHLYTRGGSHTSRRRCEGSAYKGRLKRTDGGISFTKEIQHDDYASARRTPSLYLEKGSAKGRYIGSKFIVYNLPQDPKTGRTPVKMEYWVDEYGMTQDGKFDPAKQNWRKLMETVDTGGWSECGDGSGRNCPPVEIGNNTGQRKCDEILNTGGGTSAGNIVCYRTDSVRSKIKYYSAREIVTP